ncbi:hypothetical protein C8R47DRAFT_1228445 [Mycena vitilis]|nr:hypothetical protein C8R47DRAFT_1228445 [Mycena vitilis]
MAYFTPATPTATPAAHPDLAAAMQTLTSAVDAMSSASARVANTPVSDCKFGLYVFTILATVNQTGAAVADAAAQVVNAAVINAAAASSVGSTPASTSTPAVAPTPTSPFVRTSGPWVAGRIYGVVPQGPLVAMADAGEGKWYAITRGRYVGLTKNSAISLHATSGVSSGLSDKYSAQWEALEHFNSALSLGAVAVINEGFGIFFSRPPALDAHARCSA